MTDDSQNYDLGEERSEAETVPEQAPEVQFGEDCHSAKEVRILEEAAAAAFLAEESQATSSAPAAASATPGQPSSRCGVKRANPAGDLSASGAKPVDFGGSIRTICKSCLSSLQITTTWTHVTTAPVAWPPPVKNENDDSS